MQLKQTLTQYIVAWIFANFNGWNFQWLEQNFNRLNFFAYFCQAQWLEKSNGWTSFQRLNKIVEMTAHILKLHPSSWRCNLKIWMHLDHMLKFLFLDATWSFKIKMITFARLYKPLLEDDSSSFTLVQSWNFDPARSRLNFFYPS